MIYFQPFIMINILIIKFHDAVHQVEMVLGQDQSPSGRALFAQIRNKGIHNSRIAYRQQMSMEMSIQFLFKLLQRMAVFRQNMKADGILYISSKIRNFIRNFDDAAFPCIRFKFIGTLDGFQVNRFVPGRRTV